MSNSNQAFMDYLNASMSNSNQAFMDIPHSISSFFRRYRYSVQLQPQSSFIPISTNYPPQSPTFYRGYNTTTPTYYFPMERYSTLPSTQGPVEHVDEVAIISDSDDMFEIQTQTGRVNDPGGLSEKTISKKLKTSCYRIACGVAEQEVCAVCQDEYKVSEMIGTLECGHKYHAKCIKQWLLLKNVCPVCRATVSIV